ncbi:MAG: DUF1553 domain-containing protein [Bacteroidota bacterium]
MPTTTLFQLQGGRSVSLLFCGLLLIVTFLACQKPSSTIEESGARVPEIVDFNFHIKPILSDRCFKCHGPDEKVREADLRFDVKEGAFAALDSAEERFAIVPGDTENSQILHRIKHHDPDELMPPPESNLSLSDHEIALLEKWIEQGAEWKDHWAFIPPQKAVLPEIQQSSWPRNPIDHFTLAKMEANRLSPAEEADKIKLIRRLSFDLTGLPPSLEEVDAFLEDDSDDAYEKLVDHYLASSSFGEKMAVPWLDLARYADTYGYQDDLSRTSWPWRDWVIQAFNDNMPFDQFTTWQLAGDLLPDASYDQKLATAFNRNHPITQEGGVVPEEYRVEYVADRTQTIATTFLGLTMQCARCHDHKYDPISQKEFYRLFAFNNSVPEAGLIGYSGRAEPDLPIPQSQLDDINGWLNKDVRKVKDRLVTIKEEKRNASQTAFGTWRQEQANQTGNSSNLPTGLIERFSFDDMKEDHYANLVNPRHPAQLKYDPTDAKGKFSGCVEFNGKGDIEQHENHLNLGQVGDFGLNDPFTISFWMKFGWANNFAAVVSKLDRENNRGYEFVIQDRYMAVKIGGSKGFNARVLNSLVEKTWSHFAVSYDGSGRSSGLRVFQDGEPVDFMVFGEKKGLQNIKLKRMKTSSPFLVGKEGTENGQRFRAPMQVDELQIYDRALSRKEVADLYAFDPIAALLQKDHLTEQEKESLYLHYLHHNDPEFQLAIQELSHQKVIQQQVREQLQPTLIMKELAEPRPAYVLRRGAYDAREEQVDPGTPSTVLDFPDHLPPNRLGLAQWILDPQNPLTARVIMNRYWHMIFGEGIVRTLDDFGSQGDLPSHPAMLDWLAIEFINSKWDIKHMIKTIVSSATYRQSSKVSREQYQKDPQNVWLSRAPQYRLPAELIRDNVLATSGLLVDKIGGPSVKPYQPTGLWAELSCGRGTKSYTQEHGDALYRKSLYTFWKRTVPPPTMITFDAATRNYCVPKRQTTSTPLQALILLNDPQYLEAARVFASNMIQEGGEDVESRIRFGFRKATSRMPRKQELSILEDILQSERANYENDPDSAIEFLSIGEMPADPEFDPAELAAYAHVATAIFNLDETITKY